MVYLKAALSWLWLSAHTGIERPVQSEILSHLASAPSQPLVTWWMPQLRVETSFKAGLYSLGSLYHTLSPGYSMYAVCSMQ